MAFSSATETGLKKTSEEKLILRNISALEKSIEEETSEERRKELGTQLSSLKDHLQGPSEQTVLDVDLTNSKEEEKLNKLYKILLEKHAKLINEQETKTVGEIKVLINKEDLSIQAVVNSFVPENYNSKNHFFQAAEKAYNYIVNEIAFVNTELNISFWLTPKEIISEKIGDDEDQAVLLCSFLYALGDENAEVVIAELENGNAHAFVITEFNNKFLLLDPTQGKEFRKFFGEKKEVLETYSYNESHIKRFMYKFNHSKYEQFVTEEE
ncbi:MAG: transglutaminase-like domain-containing protein [Candidatus Diapherotrites archaeon]